MTISVSRSSPTPRRSSRWWYIGIGSWASHASTSSAGRYVPGSARLCPPWRYVFVSISDGPPPARARSIAARAARYTASASLPSTTVGSRPYAAARSAAGWRTAVTSPIAVYSMYRLFSHTKIVGSWYTAAKLSASWKAPMFVAPSPKKATAT